MKAPLALVLLAGATLFGACQSTAQPAPAVLANSEPATMERLKTALARAMGQPQVQLGPGDPVQTSVLSVLPRPPGPYEDRSLARPTIFRLEISSGACFVVRDDTGARERIDGVECRPAAR